MNNIAQTDRQNIPFLSSIPIIGNLFKSKGARQSRTELMVLITPRLVKPLDPDEVPDAADRRHTVPEGSRLVGIDVERRFRHGGRAERWRPPGEQTVGMHSMRWRTE